MVDISIYVAAALIVIGTLAILGLLTSMFNKVGPNQALIVYGFGGMRVVRSGGAFVWPIVQKCRDLSLELMSFDVAPQQNLYTNQGVAVTVEAVAQLKVKSDPESILTSAEQFLDKDFDQRQALIRLVMEGHLRGIVGQLTVEQIVKEPEMVSAKMRSTCAEDMAKMGLEVVSFTIKEVKDQNEYITNMGKPDIARIKKEADIAAAEADRDTSIKRAIAEREAAVAKAQADQERVIAQTQSEGKQAEARRDLEMLQAQYQATVQQQQAQTDKAYEIQANIQQQQVIAEQVRVDRVKKEEEIKVQEMEIQRREKELIATVLKQAEMEKQRIQTIAEAERQRSILEAQGKAEAVRAQGQAEADVVKMRGTAEAEIILSKGKNEAEAMEAKASAYHNYSEAAILDKLLSGIPEVVRGMAEPLSKVDKITIVSTGNGDHGAGMNQITTDLTRMIAQAPALFESLTGMKIGELMDRLPSLTAASASSGNGKSQHKLRTSDSDQDTQAS